MLKEKEEEMDRIRKDADKELKEKTFATQKAEEETQRAERVVQRAKRYSRKNT